jgi:hypothetical protein
MIFTLDTIIVGPVATKYDTYRSPIHDKLSRTHLYINCLPGERDNPEPGRLSLKRKLGLKLPRPGAYYMGTSYMYRGGWGGARDHLALD